MNIGMLWFDNDPKADLKLKIERAASYYQTKYGQSPNLCFVHPSMIAEENGKQGSNGKTSPVEIRPNHSVLPNHFWIGINSSSIRSAE